MRGMTMATTVGPGHQIGYLQNTPVAALIFQSFAMRLYIRPKTAGP